MFRLYIACILILELFIYALYTWKRRMKHTEGLQESVVVHYFWKNYKKCKRIDEKVFIDLKEEFGGIEIDTLKHAKCLLEADLSFCVIGGALISVIQTVITVWCGTIPKIIFAENEMGQSYDIGVNILRMWILIVLALFIYSLAMTYKKEKYCLEVLKVVLTERKNADPELEYGKRENRQIETINGGGNILKEKKKGVFKYSLRVLAIWLGYYVFLLCVYCIVEVTTGVKYITIKELLSCYMMAFIPLFLFEVMANIPLRISTEKKLLLKDDVSSVLQDISLDQYKDVLEQKNKDEILDMYRKLHEADRRRYAISLKNIYGSIIVALLPVVATLLLERCQGMGNADVISALIAFFLVLPLLLDLVYFVLGIIENDKVHRTPSIEKDTEDKIVKELAKKYIGLDEK